jgi:hypothetical protein
VVLTTENTQFLLKMLSKMLQLFEISAKSFAEKYTPENIDTIRKILEKNPDYDYIDIISSILGGEEQTSLLSHNIQKIYS